VRRFQCDEQYIEALGRAVFSFAALEYNVAYIIERLEPGYLLKYISQKKDRNSRGPRLRSGSTAGEGTRSKSGVSRCLQYI
jgi:hypothetical protein